MKQRIFWLMYLLLYLLYLFVLLQVSYLNPFQALNGKIYSLDGYYLGLVAKIVLRTALLFLVPLVLGKLFSKKFSFWFIFYIFVLSLFQLFYFQFISTENWNLLTLGAPYYILLILQMLFFSLPISFGSTYINKLIKGK